SAVAARAPRMVRTPITLKAIRIRHPFVWPVWQGSVVGGLIQVAMPGCRRPLPRGKHTILISRPAERASKWESFPRRVASIPGRVFLHRKTGVGSRTRSCRRQAPAGDGKSVGLDKQGNFSADGELVPGRMDSADSTGSTGSSATEPREREQGARCRIDRSEP